MPAPTQVIWIQPGNHAPDNFKNYPLTDNETAIKAIFFTALAATVNTVQRRGLRINMNKFLEGVRDYIIERREGL